MAASPSMASEAAHQATKTVVDQHHFLVDPHRPPDLELHATGRASRAVGYAALTAERPDKADTSASEYPSAPKTSAVCSPIAGIGRRGCSRAPFKEIGSSGMSVCAAVVQRQLAQAAALVQVAVVEQLLRAHDGRERDVRFLRTAAPAPRPRNGAGFTQGRQQARAPARGRCWSPDADRPAGLAGRECRTARATARRRSRR